MLHRALPQRPGCADWCSLALSSKSNMCIEQYWERMSYILHVYFWSPAWRIITLMHWTQATLPNGDTFNPFKIMVAKSILWFSFICRRQITCNLCVLAGALASCVYFGPVLLWQLCLRGGWSSDWDCLDSQHINAKNFFFYGCQRSFSWGENFLTIVSA